MVFKTLVSVESAWFQLLESAVLSKKTYWVQKNILVFFITLCVAATAEGALDDAMRAEIETQRAALDLKEVDYEATVGFKLSLAKRAFERVRERFLASR